MRKWTMSACVALAWSIVIVPLLAAAGPAVPGRPVQATTSTAISTRALLASQPGTVQTILADAPGTLRSALADVPGTTQANPVSAPSRPESTSARERPAAGAVTAVPVAVTVDTVTVTLAAGQVTWTVRPGDTLSGIASALAVPGGWPALYADNRQAIGPDPDVIRPGMVLTVPGLANPARYTVAPGDTLSAISAALAVPGGWPALYADNRQAIGPDPDVIRAGTVLAVPHLVPVAAPQPTAPGQPAGSAAPASSPGVQAPPSHRATAPASPAPAVAPPTSTAAAPTANAPRSTASGGTAPAGGMPAWLVEVLVAVGVLAALAFAAEPAVALARRRQAAGAGPGPPGAPGRRRRRIRRAAAKARVILAHYDQLIVTYSVDDHTVYVLTPPGEDPRAVLRAARLVLPEDTYEDLAGHLGVSSAWPSDE